MLGRLQRAATCQSNRLKAIQKRKIGDNWEWPVPPGELRYGYGRGFGPPKFAGKTPTTREGLLFQFKAMTCCYIFAFTGYMTFSRYVRAFFLFFFLFLFLFIFFLFEFRFVSENKEKVQRKKKVFYFHFYPF